MPYLHYLYMHLHHRTRDVCFRLVGGDIPFFARVIAVADSFDAILSNRPYRRSLGVVQALGEIEAGAGRQFDPEVVRMFLRAYRLRCKSSLPPLHTDTNGTVDEELPADQAWREI